MYWEDNSTLRRGRKSIVNWMVRYSVVCPVGMIGEMSEGMMGERKERMREGMRERVAEEMANHFDRSTKEVLDTLSREMMEIADMMGEFTNSI